jgi:Fe-S cluster assembly ATP-binding protein
MLLEIKDLTVARDNKIILENLNLIINPGEIHVIMGPNGAGKSTLANVLVKHPDYNIINGYIKFLDNDLKTFTPELCAKHGIFLSFQNPIAIPGVSNMQFLKASVNAINKFHNKKPLDAIDFLTLVRQKINALGIKEEFLYRAINQDFSGGEKKRNEILQMMLLEPKLSILDEIDSGLDIDALQIVTNGIKSVKNSNNSIVIITHYQRILKYIQPDFVHILTNKKISMSGDYTLAEKLETDGYSWLN